MRDEINGKSLAIGILVGIAAGVAIGYLTSPKSGQETRDLIKGKMDEVKSSAEEILAKVKRVGAGREA